MVYDSWKDYSHKKYLTIPESSIVMEILVELPTSRSIVYDMKICLESTDAFIFFFFYFKNINLSYLTDISMLQVSPLGTPFHL